MLKWWLSGSSFKQKKQDYYKLCQNYYKYPRGESEESRPEGRSKRKTHRSVHWTTFWDGLWSSNSLEMPVLHTSSQLHHKLEKKRQRTHRKFKKKTKKREKTSAGCLSQGKPTPTRSRPKRLAKNLKRIGVNANKSTKRWRNEKRRNQRTKSVSSIPCTT